VTMIKDFELFDLFERDVDTDILALRNTAKRISGYKDIAISFLNDDLAAFTDRRVIYLPKKFKKDIKGGQGIVAHEAGHIGYGSFELNFVKLVMVLSKKFEIPPAFIKQLINVLDDVRVNAINEKKFPGFYKYLRDIELTILPTIKSRIYRYQDIITYIYLYMENYEEFQKRPLLGPFFLSLEDWKSISKIKDFIKKFSMPQATMISVYKISEILRKYIPKPKKISKDQKQAAGMGIRVPSHCIPCSEEEEEDGVGLPIIFIGQEEDRDEVEEEISDFDILTRWNEIREFEDNSGGENEGENSKFQKFSDDLIDTFENIDLKIEDLEEIEKEFQVHMDGRDGWEDFLDDISVKNDLKDFTASLNEKYENLDITTEKLEEIISVLDKLEESNENFLDDETKLQKFQEKFREEFKDRNIKGEELKELLFDIDRFRKQEKFLEEQKISPFFEDSNLKILSEELKENFGGVEVTPDDLKDVLEEIEIERKKSGDKWDQKKDLEIFVERLKEKFQIEDVNLEQLQISLKSLNLIDDETGKLDIEELLTNKKRRIKIKVMKKIAETLKDSMEELENRLKELEFGSKVFQLGGDFADRKVIETTIDQENMNPINLTFNQIKLQHANQIKKIKQIFSELRNHRDFDTFQTRGRLNNKLIKAITSDYKFKRCFTRKTMEKTLRLLIIVDISGSMKGIKMRTAKIALTLLCEALESIAQLRIVLFTGNYDAINILVKDFNERINPKKFDKFGSHGTYLQNLDGISIKHEANKLQQGDFIIVISDGQPAGDGNYGLTEAVADIREVKKIFKIFAFSIDAKGNYLNQLYDKNWLLVYSANESELSEKMIMLCKNIVREFYN